MASKSIYHWIMVCLIDPSILVPMAGYAWSRLRPRYQSPPWIRPFLWTQIFDLAQGSVFIALALSHRNNQWLRHVAQPLVFLGFLWTLFQLAPPSRGRRILYGAGLAAGLAAAFAGLALDGMTWRNSVFTSTMSLIYLGLVTWELSSLAQSDNEGRLTDFPAFWLLAALLIYSSGTLIFNASSNYFLRTLPPHLLPIPWILSGLIHVIYEAMLAKVFLCPTPSSS